MNNIFIKEITKVVGQENILLQKNEMEPYLQERRGLYRGVCFAVIMPGSTREVSDVVKLCNHHSISFTPQSGNTGLCGGAVPAGGILINLKRMNTIRNIDPLNATITAEAGCILANLQNVARRQGLLFTLSSPSENDCQIGGNISTNLGGINVLRYGNTRDLVLGLEVVLPSGDIWHGLRGLRKDNAGYDLKHLFIGAEGTLGIVTTATLKLSPYPRLQQTAMVATSSLAELMDAFVTVRKQFADNLCGFEIISRTAMEVVCECGENSGEPFDFPFAWYGLLELNSTDPDLDLFGSLNTLLKESPFDFRIAASEKQAEELWTLREQISDAQKKKGASIKHDVSLPLNRLVDFIEEATALVKQRIPGVLVCCFGHAGDGNVHFNLTQPADMEGAVFLKLWAEINMMVHDVVHRMEGSIAAEHGVGQLKKDELKRYKDPVELEMMRAIKRALDPNNLSNPGKVIDTDV